MTPRPEDLCKTVVAEHNDGKHLSMTTTTTTKTTTTSEASCQEIYGPYPKVRTRGQNAFLLLAVCLLYDCRLLNAKFFTLL